jgi:hypothetical protein
VGENAKSARFWWYVLGSLVVLVGIGVAFDCVAGMAEARRKVLVDTSQVVGSFGLIATAATVLLALWQLQEQRAAMLEQARLQRGALAEQRRATAFARFEPLRLVYSTVAAAAHDVLRATIKSDDEDGISEALAALSRAAAIAQLQDRSVDRRVTVEHMFDAVAERHFEANHVAYQRCPGAQEPQRHGPSCPTS